MSRHGIFWHSARVWLTALLASVAIVSGADKNGVSPNTISLPTGPGSVEGLGESFQPSLNTGTAKYGMAIKLPPGTAGHQPTIRLSYDGGGANGTLGFGWDLSIPSIQRRTDQGIPTYGEGVGISRPDAFITSDREELVPQADGFWFCRNESAFVRYRQVGHHWEGTRQDGTRLQFGLTDAARIIDAEVPSRVFSWLLERETDTRGNVIEYTYRSFPGAQNQNQKYPSVIRYGPGAPPWSHFHFVSFEYSDRPDWFEDARSGFLLRTGKRMTSIRVGSQGATLSGQLAGDFDHDGTPDWLNRRYQLEYLSYDGDGSHWSLLAKVTLIGADGLTSLPAATFDYQVSNPPEVLSSTTETWGSIGEPAAVMDNPLVDLIDLNADGLPDVLRTEAGGGSHTAWINRGPVGEGEDRAILWAAAAEVDPGTGAATNFDLASERTHLADMNGDGLADLVHRTAEASVFYFANRGNLTWAPRTDMASASAPPPSPFGQAGVRTADVDFDKRIDIIQSLDLGGGTGYRVWFNLGDETYSAPITTEPEGGFDFSLSGVHLADCNGDRVPDVARIRAGAVHVAVGLGYGRFAAPRTLVLPDVSLDDQQIERATLNDINGDGLADLVLERASPGTCWYWLNLGNFTLSPRKIIAGLPATSSSAAVRWADMNGNGSIDLVYADAQSRPRLQMVDLGSLLTGGLAPNLLTAIDNGIGRTIRIEYAPSTRFMLEDAAAGNPWPDALPFPVTVVSGMKVSDSLSNEYETRFRYHDGYYDAVEKQFRGFARVEQIEVGDSTAPTLVARSHFDTGREFESMKGRLLRVSTETVGGQVFTIDSTIWASPPRTLMVGTNGEPVQYAHPTATVREILEQGQGTPRRLETESAFDNYGNLTRAADYGIVEGADRSAFNDERITTTEYAINTEAWILRLVKSQRIADENGVLISRRESFYDDESFSGANPGSVLRGNRTLERVWITPAEDGDYVSASRARYDTFGNPIMLFDALAETTGDASKGHFREVAYDAGFHTYPIRETVHVGGGNPSLVMVAAYNEGLATVLSSIDFNGHSTTYGYDALGRLTHLVHPGDTAAYPTMEYDYALAVPYGIGGVINYVESRSLDQAPGSADSQRGHYLISRRYVDGLGRALMTKTEAEPVAGSSAPRVAVSGAVQFNARQKPSRSLNPFFTAMAGTLEEMLAYEHISAPGWRGGFHENGAFLDLDVVTAHQTAWHYDATLRPLRTVNPDGTTTRTEYEPLITLSFDEIDDNPALASSGTPMIQHADGLGRLIRLDERVRLNDDGTPSGSISNWTTQYQYDLHDALTRITDPANNIKEFRYDGLKRKLWMNDPDAGISTYQYDDASNITESRDAKGQRITFTYDGVNRVLTEDYHDETSTEHSYARTPDIRFHYDRAPGPVDMGDGTTAVAGNVRGALAWVEDASGQEHTSFDDRGRVAWTVKQIPDPISPSVLVSYRTGFAYDSMDRLVRLTYPDNDEIDYRYNARSLLEEISGGSAGSIVSNSGYLASTQVHDLEHGNGVRTTYGYDTRQRLGSLTAAHPARPTEPLLQMEYDFDGVSNLQAIHDRRPLSQVPADSPRRNSQQFAYDDVYRLTRVQYNAPNTAVTNGGSINYRYDQIGNMLSQTSDINHVEGGGSLTNTGTSSYGAARGPRDRHGRQAGDPPGPHALTGMLAPGPATEARAFTYDSNGNLTEADGLSLTWDFRDRLVAAEDESTRAEYRYDYTGRRITKRVIPKPASVGSSFPVSTSYVNKHYEVRPYDEAVKYVFSGTTRVAKITRSLASNLRVQRLRLQSGWNLCSTAVHGAALPEDPAIEKAYRWVAATDSYLAVEPQESLPAGSVLWIKSASAAILPLVGAYAPPGAVTIPSGQSLLAARGLEAWPLEFPPTITASVFSPLNRQWHRGFMGELSSLSDLPAVLPPGGALFVQAAAAVELVPPDLHAQILFYHQDHLGSSSAVTDSVGNLVEETAHYPFGVPRHQHRPGKVRSYYGFTQKEQDQESGLHYFEARYMAADLSRFLTPDPMYLIPDALDAVSMGRFMTNSQMLNVYAYALNNPLKYSDPSGLNTKSDLETVDNINDTRDFILTVVDTVAKEHGLVSDTTKVIGKIAIPIGPLVDGIAVITNPSSETASTFASTVGLTALGIVNAPVGLAVFISKVSGGPDIQKGLHDLGTAIGGALAEPSAIDIAREKMEIKIMTQAKFNKMSDQHMLNALNNPGAFRGNHPLPGSTAKQPQTNSTAVNPMDKAASRVATEWNNTLRSQSSR